LSLAKEKESSGEIVDTQVLKQLYTFVKPYKRQFNFLIFLTVALAILAPTRPYFIQIAIDDYVTVGDTVGLLQIIYLLIGLLVIQAIVQWAHTYYSGWIGQVIIRDIRVKLYKNSLIIRRLED
jgi:ATP-binding cassette subfamily B protein